MADGAASLIPSRTARMRDAAIMPLHLQDVSLHLDGRAVLDRITLDLGPVGCTMVMGPNGAGKSQLFRILHGLRQPDAGRIDWNGSATQDARWRQAMVFQKPVLLRRSVAANVDFVLHARRSDRTRVSALLDLVGLADKAGQPARQLSGGEQQCLALARALATDPEVLFLDEPTASLSPASVRAIETIVRGALDRGTRVIFITHDAGQARRLADDVVFLHQGRVAAHGPADTFFSNPPAGVVRKYLAGDILN